MFQFQATEHKIYMNKLKQIQETMTRVVRTERRSL